MDTLFGKFTRKTKKEPEKQNDEEYKPKEEEPLTFKILFVGGIGVGAKTCFVNRYVRNIFPEFTEATPGASFFTKHTVSRGKEVSLKMWDTNGHTRFVQIAAQMYLRGAAGVVLGYDVTDRSTFDAVRRRYLSYTKEYPNILFMVIGHKADLEEQRDVSKEEGESLAKEFNNALFFESKPKNRNRNKNDGFSFFIDFAFIASAKTGYNIRESMNALVDMILESKGY